MDTAAAFLYLKHSHYGLVLVNPRANNGRIIVIPPILDQSYSFFIGLTVTLRSGVRHNTRLAHHMNIALLNYRLILHCNFL